MAIKASSYFHREVDYEEWDTYSDYYGMKFHVGRDSLCRCIVPETGDQCAIFRNISNLGERPVICFRGWQPTRLNSKVSGRK